MQKLRSNFRVHLNSKEIPAAKGDSQVEAVLFVLFPIPRKRTHDSFIINSFQVHKYHCVSLCNNAESKHFYS